MFTRILNTAISATNIVVGTTYDIVSLGSTTQNNWNTIAGTSSVTYAVGDTFSAAAGGTGTGTVSRISITQANITINAYDSGTTYSDGNLVRFNNQTYEKQTLTPPSGVRVTFGSNETANNLNGRLDFSQVIGSGQSNLAFNTTNSIGVDNPNAVNFDGRRFYRTNGANALTKKVTQWTGLINTDGILTATSDITGSDPTIELFNSDNSTMTVPTITGVVRFGMSIEAITATGTSGNPDTDTDNWKTSSVNPTDENLLLLAGVDGVTESFQGSIAHYRPGAGVKVDVSGTLTINPEVDVLDSDSNKIMTVKSGGILYVGLELVSPYDNTTRKTEGMAITGKRAQPIWYGGSANNSSIDVESGGTIVFTGATTKFPGGYYFADGSHVWINGLKHNPVDYVIEEKTIDPQTGVAVVDSNAADAGVNVGTGERLSFKNRGYISWSDATDIRVDNFELIGGGELTFGNIPDLSSTNTLSGTTNGLVGYSAAGAKSPVLITQLIPKLSGQPPFVMENTRLANSGNFKGGIALQSDGSGGSSGIVLGTALLTNAYFGTELVLGSDKLLADGRNWGVALLGRDINVEIRDGITGNTISGGAFFYRDYNVNNQRKDIVLVVANPIITPPIVEVSRDDTADRTLISTLSSGKLSADHEVILKIVSVAAGVKKGGTSNDIRGIDRSFDITRTNSTTLTYDGTNFGAAETTDVFNFYVTPAVGNYTAATASQFTLQTNGGTYSTSPTNTGTVGSSESLWEGTGVFDFTGTVTGTGTITLGNFGFFQPGVFGLGAGSTASRIGLSNPTGSVWSFRIRVDKSSSNTSVSGASNNTSTPPTVGELGSAVTTLGPTNQTIASSGNVGFELNTTGNVSVVWDFVPEDSSPTHTAVTPTASQTAFSVSSGEADTIVCRILKEFNADHFLGDLRTKSGIEGEDTFDFVFWHEDYNPALFLDYNVTDETVGTKILVANILSDADYSSTSSSNNPTADTPDELYDFIKQTKCDSTEAVSTGVEYPTLTTFAVSKSDGLLDIGSRTFATENSTSQYTISDIALSAHTTGFGGGTVFSGIKTTGSINLNNITLSTCVVETTGSLTNLPDTIAAGADITGTYSTTADKTLTVDEGDDYLGLALIVAANTTLTILGKSSISDFASINVTATGASVVFPIAATRLTIELSLLPIGAAYVVYNDSTSYQTSPTIKATTQYSDLELSNTASDGDFDHISSGLGGNWYLYYVDTNKRATFKGVTVVETDSTTVIEEFKLTPTEFPIAFEVPSASTTGRRLLVSDTDEQPFTFSGVSLDQDFPRFTSSLSFSNDDDAITFMLALGLTNVSNDTQAVAGNLFLKGGASGEVLDFTGASFVRSGFLVSVEVIDITGLTFDSGDSLFIGTEAPRVEFDLGGCPVSNWADESQSSLLVANARNSVNYLNAMARQISRDDLLSIPTGENNNSVITFDAVRPVLSGADWREGRYYIMDTDDGSQKVSGWYEVEDSNTFTQGTRTDRELTNLESLILDDGDVQIQSQVRLLSSTSSVVGGVRSLTDPIISIVESIETKVDTVDTVVDSIETKTDTIDTVVDSIETKVDTLDTVVDQIDGVNNFTAQQINDLGLVSDFDKTDLPSIDDI